MKNKRRQCLLSAVLALVIAGHLAAIEVTPPSPVQALSPTVISVTYAAADNSFVFVIGVVDGQMYLPEVNDAGPGKLTFSGPPGTYAIMGMESGKRIQQTVIVEGDDSPDPPPPPPQPGKRLVVVVRESADDSPELKLATQAVQKYQAGKGKGLYRLMDDDAVGPNGPLLWLQEILAKAETAKIPLPFMAVIASSEGGEDSVSIVPFPLDGGKAIQEIKKRGG